MVYSVAGPHLVPATATAPGHHTSRRCCSDSSSLNTDGGWQNCHCVQPRELANSCQINKLYWKVEDVLG